MFIGESRRKEGSNQNAFIEYCMIMSNRDFGCSLLITQIQGNHSQNERESQDFKPN